MAPSKIQSVVVEKPVETSSAPVQKNDRFQKLDLNYNATRNLYNKETNSVIAKTAYVVAAVVVALLETLENAGRGIANVFIGVANGVNKLLQPKQPIDLQQVVVEKLESNPEKVRALASEAPKSEAPKQTQAKQEQKEASVLKRTWDYVTTHKMQLALGLVTVGAIGAAGYVYGVPDFLGSSYGYGYGYGENGSFFDRFFSFWR